MEKIISNKMETKERLQKFADKTIMVIGDFCLDEYIYGHANEISPEFSVPWMFINNKDHIPGAAGNISSGISALGAQVYAVGVIGNDINGTILKKSLEERGVQTQGLIQSDKRKTATYSRLVCGGKKRAKQHLARFDIENKDSILPEDISKTFNFIRENIQKVDAIIVADYDDVGNIGLISPELCNELLKLSKLYNKKIIGDSRREIKKYNGFNLIVPNEDEAQQLIKSPLNSEENVAQAGEALKNALNLEALMITRGAQGISVFHENNFSTHPSKVKEVIDVCGAGDTVTCIATLSWLSGASLKESAELANIGASITVSKEGTVSVSREQIYEQLNKETTLGKVIERNKVGEVAAQIKKEGKKIIFLNGYFDPLHTGHIHLINKAKEYGDTIIVGINSDQSVRENKGPNRPFMNEETRKNLLQSLEAVDHIVIFNELTPIRLIQEIKPDMIAKGNNYRTEQVVGKDIVESYGGKILLLDVIEGLSSEKILASIDQTKQSKRNKILNMIEHQKGILFAEAATVYRCQYSGRDIIAKNSKFTEGYVDDRGYVPVEWWIMSKTPAENEITKENEGLSYLFLENGEKILFKDAIEIAGEDLLGDYVEAWPLTKILDIGGEQIKSSFSESPEVPPIPVHVHSGDIIEGKAVGPGKLEAYFFPKVNVPPYNKDLSGTITRLGLKPGVSKEEVIQRLKHFGQDDSMYEVCNTFEVNAYDGWTILPGVIHSPGPWTTFEIQTPQDDFNLGSWQLGQRFNENELPEKKRSLQLRGLKDEEDFVNQVINWEQSQDPNFKDKWYRKSQVLQEGPWGKQLQIFFDNFYGEAFEINSSAIWTRNADNKPFAGIVWSGQGTINGNPISAENKNTKEFLVTPKNSLSIVNTGDIPLIIYTVFPIKPIASNTSSGSINAMHL